MTTKATTSIGDALHSLDLSDDQLQARWGVSNFGGAVGITFINKIAYLIDDGLFNSNVEFEKLVNKTVSNMIVNIFYMFASLESTSQIMHQSA